MPQSSEISAKRKPTLPEKPYPEFPLFAHQTGRWAKKIRQKLRFYGRWGKSVSGKVVPVNDVNASAAAAQLEFERCWPYHSQGNDAPDPADQEQQAESVDYLTLGDLCNHYLEKKQNRLDTRELSLHTFSECHRICEKLVEHLGRNRRVDALMPADFEKLRTWLAKGCNVVTLKSKINRARGVFKHAFSARLIDRPVDYGASFDRPKPMKLREAKNNAGPNLFAHEEIQMILTALDGKPVIVKGEDKPLIWPASATMRAMVLLGLNCAFGNTDCANLPQKAINLKKGWLEFPRPKTAVRRRIPLWPETVLAIRQAIDERPAPADPADADLCFLTERGSRFVRIQESKTTEDRHVTINSLSRRFEKLLSALKIGERKGTGFYTLRHVFETVAGGSKDQVAVDGIMGHLDPSMAAEYREGLLDDGRLKDVTDYVRAWLWPTAEKKAAKKTIKRENA